MTSYLPRLCDATLASYLETFGAVLVEGPKWCGKTTTSARFAKSELRIADPRGSYQNRRLAEVDVDAALEGARPRLIDEWQEVPSTWDAVRYKCDEVGGEPGQFILTGSATPREYEKPVHSGAGRIGRLRMDTLTLSELGISSGKSSMSAMLGGAVPAGVSSMGINDIAEIVCRGGWPATVDATTQRCMRIAASYIDAVAEEDLVRLDGISRDPAKVRRLIRSLARNEATLASNKAIIRDMGEEAQVSAVTAADYVTALGKVFFVDDIPAWAPALRSPIRIRAAKKRHLADPSLAAAALGATPKSLVADPKTLGFLFESLVTHDLLAIARYLEASIYHYRDDSNLEVDLILQRNDGDWAAFEVKLGAAQVDDAAKSLLSLEGKMVSHGERPPLLKAVIVGVGGVSQLRPDGVAVIPVDTLGL